MMRGCEWYRGDQRRNWNRGGGIEKLAPELASWVCELFSCTGLFAQKCPTLGLMLC